MAELNLMEVLAKDPANMTAEELNFIISYQAKLTAAKKVAKEKGVITAKVKVEKSPEVQLLATAFEAVITANVETIKGLFPVSADKKAGAKGYNIATSADCPFYIQILNKAAFKLDAEENKEKKELDALKKKKEPTDADKARIEVLEAKYNPAPAAPAEKPTEEAKTL